MTKSLITIDVKRPVSRFLRPDCVETGETYSRTTNQCGGNCKSRRKVCEWVKIFKGRQTNAVNDVCCGWPSTVKCVEGQVEMYLNTQENRKISTYKSMYEFGVMKRRKH
jgi:hypothetical protein